MQSGDRQRAETEKGIAKTGNMAHLGDLKLVQLNYVV